MQKLLAGSILQIDPHGLGWLTVRDLAKSNGEVLCRLKNHGAGCKPAPAEEIWNYRLIPKRVFKKFLRDSKTSPRAFIATFWSAALCPFNP